jgi:hypothetical protein
MYLLTLPLLSSREKREQARIRGMRSAATNALNLSEKQRLRLIRP